MQDSPRDQPTIVGVLCAFVRGHAKSVVAKASRPAVTAQTSAISSDLPTDIQAALTVVGSRDRANDGDTTVNLSGAKLAGADLSGMNFAWADLVGADFAGANFAGSYLDHSDFAYADVTGANFGGATTTNLDTRGTKGLQAAICLLPMGSAIASKDTELH
jgi:Pentapeptide repeats (8 copies)